MPPKEMSFERFEKQVINFKNQYFAFVNKHQDDFLSDFRNKFIKIKTNYGLLSRINDEYNLNIAPSFNIFKEMERAFNEKGKFIYLTISGEEPGKDGFDDAIYPKDQIMDKITLMSYKKDILTWLNGLSPR